MKKRGLAGLILAVLLTFAAGFTAMAAEGWVKESGGWAYYNSSGSRVTNAWRMDENGYWRYLDSNGYMATDKWVDNDDYYVDSNGIMIAGTWLKVTNYESDSGYDWYYFSSTGKCVKDKWSQIDGTYYYFDDTGVMQTGWLLDDMYYCDENGAMVTGWNYLFPSEDSEYYEDYNNYSPTPYENSVDGKYWYYFSTSGKKVVPDDDSDDDNIKQKKINGTYYCLREDGAMLTGWVCVTGDDSDTIEDYRYVDTNGQVVTGWYSTNPPEDLENNYDYEVEWFYFNSKGVPKVGPADGTATSSDLVKINGNTYLFSEYGNPVYGLKKIYIDSDETDYTAYYFGTRSQSSMLKGKQTVDEGGDDVTYYFSSSGRGYTGVYSNYLYYMGKLQEADSGSRYEVFSIPTSSGYKNYVVNTSGRVQKSTTVKDKSGTKYKTNSSGILTEEDGEEVSDSATYSDPIEPDWSSYD